VGSVCSGHCIVSADCTPINHQYGRGSKHLHGVTLERTDIMQVQQDTHSAHLSLPVVVPVWPCQRLSQVRCTLQDLVVHTDAAAPAAQAPRLGIAQAQQRDDVCVHMQGTGSGRC